MNTPLCGNPAFLGTHTPLCGTDVFIGMYQVNMLLCGSTVTFGVDMSLGECKPLPSSTVNNRVKKYAVRQYCTQLHIHWREYATARKGLYSLV